jgi:hypothetical protein
MKLATAVVLLLATSLLAETKPQKTTTPKYECKPTADEQCPSAEDYATLKTFIDKYRAPQSEQDRIIGLQMRLQQNAPPGYHWDGQKLLYVKNPEPPKAEKK